MPVDVHEGDGAEYDGQLELLATVVARCVDKVRFLCGFDCGRK
jgi:hypothetical protein